MSKVRNGNIIALAATTKASTRAAHPQNVQQQVEQRLSGGLGLLLESAAMFAVLGATVTLTLLPIL